MQRLQAYKFELRPTGEQSHNLRRFAGCCRFVYNQGLAEQIRRYAADSTARFSYVVLANQLPAWKKQYPWLKDAPSQALQQALKDLERAYQNFFAQRAKFPRFKKKGVRDSCRFPQGVKLDQSNSRIFLPKLGWLRYRNSREVRGTVKNVTVSLTAGKWYVSVQTERTVEQPLPEASTSVGIDMGVARFATLSDGSFIAPLNSFRRHEQRLASYQRAMSRKQKFSNNWKKAKARVQRMHARIANIRRDFLHKTSHAISKNHAVVCIEDLQVGNMSRSAAGTLSAPGRNVRAKAGLNKSILDQGWYAFRRQLEYKVASNGGMMIAVPPQYTSQTCPCCGHASQYNRKSQAKFECLACGFSEHADRVGALNILARGHRVLACGEPAQSGHSMKQEPTEATGRSNCSSGAVGVLAI